jgi:hypothetical protein
VARYNAWLLLLENFCVYFLGFQYLALKNVTSVERMNDYEKQLKLVVIPKYVSPSEKLVMWGESLFQGNIN